MRKGVAAMSAVRPITGRQSGEICRLLEERQFGHDKAQRILVGMPNETVGLLEGLDTHPDVMVSVVSILAADPELLAAKVAEAEAELDSRPEFGDYLLAGRDIVVNSELGPRGCTIPAETPLTALRPVGFLREGGGNWIRGTKMQKRALDEASPCYAPWGRDLLWRILNNKDGEGDEFLATLDESKYYPFAGDQDLQGSDGDRVVLCLGCFGGRWCWRYDCVHNNWYANDRLFSLGNSSD